MSWVVEKSVGRTDLAAVLASMRVWLDHNHCNPARFETAAGPEGLVLIRAEFDVPSLAERFGRAFDGDMAAAA